MLCNLPFVWNTVHVHAEKWLEASHSSSSHCLSSETQQGQRLLPLISTLVLSKSFLLLSAFVPPPPQNTHDCHSSSFMAFWKKKTTLKCIIAKNVLTRHWRFWLHCLHHRVRVVSQKSWNWTMAGSGRILWFGWGSSRLFFFFKLVWEDGAAAS